MNWRRWAPVVGLCALAVLFYWKLALTTDYAWFDHPDMCFIEIPRLQAQAREFHNGRFPLWDPYIWMGQPFIGQTQPGPLFPLNLLFSLAPLKDGYINFRFLNWYWVLLHGIAALGMYALCRELRRSTYASMLAGVAFAFSGFMVSAAWLDVLNGAVWTPLICLFFFRAVRGPRPLSNAAFCGAVLGLAWLSGHHEIPMLVSYALLAAWLVSALRRGPRLLVPAALTFVVAGLIAAMQLWPTAEFARLSERWIGLERSYKWDEKIPYIAPTHYSMPVKALLGTLFDNSTRYGDNTPFTGVAVVGLALLGVAASWRRPRVRAFTLLAVVATVFALGALTPLHGWLFSLAPMLGKARVPVRAVHLLNFALAVLAAYGLDRAIGAPAGVWVRRVKLGLLALGTLILASTIWRPDVPESMQWAAFSALALAIALHSRRKPAVLAAIAISVVALELYPVANARIADRHNASQFQFVRTLTDNHDIAAFLRSESFPRRVTVNDSDVPTNYGDWHGIEMMEGYVAGVSSNLLRYGRHTKGAQDLFGITHHVGRQPNHPHQVEVFTGATGVKVYRNPTVLPRAWAVHQIERVSDGSALGARIDSAEFDPRKAALVTGEVPALESCEGSTAEVIAHAPNRVRIRASMKCRGLVNLSDTYYPGWQARVDRAPVPLIETYGALRGVVVDAGTHEIDMAYRPRSVYGGLALTALGLLFLPAVVVFENVRWRRRRQ